MRSQWIEWMEMGSLALQTWRVLWVNWWRNRGTWNTGTVNKSLPVGRFNLPIELPSKSSPTSIMYYPPLVPTVVFAIVRGLPLPPPLDVPCSWCEYYFCSPYCPGQQYRFFQQHIWGRDSSQNRNRTGFRNVGTPYSNHFIHTSISSTTISRDGYIGLYPGMAWIEASDNTRGGGQV